MVIYNTPTSLAGCGMYGADDVAPVFPPNENEISIGPNPELPQATMPVTSFDKQVAAALKPLPSWAIGVGIAAVALGVVGAVYAISRRV